MKAILLAAGVGDRLRPFTDEHPKCLIDIGGRSLLHRHLDLLSAMPGLDGLLIVVGYREDQIRDAVAIWHRQTGRDFPVTFEVNPEFRKGSILSLYAARDVLTAEGGIAMDADVLYPPEVMRRLVQSSHANCFLIDERARETGEEMMVCVKDGRAMHIARSRDPSTHQGWDLKGEGVGFFRVAQADAPRLVEIMGEMVAAGIDRVEYEEALARFMKERPCGWETIGDLPWTEIDFIEDVERAARDILPRIEARTEGAS